MSIKATWKNLIPGTEVRCIYHNHRLMATGVLNRAEHSVHSNSINEGKIVVTFSDGIQEDNWGSLTSFEVVGPLVNWQNIIPDLPARLVDRDLISRRPGLIWGDTGIIEQVDSVAKTFIFHDSGGGRIFLSEVGGFEILLPPCDLTDIEVGNIVCCLSKTSRQYGNLGTVKEIDKQYPSPNGNGLVSVGYSSGYPLNASYDKPWQLAKMPVKPVEVNVGVRAGRITEVISDVPKPTAIPVFDWDAYHGKKTIKAQGRIVLDPHGGVRRIKS